MKYCSINGTYCEYATNLGFCERTACCNPNLVANTIKKEEQNTNWHTGKPTEKGWYLIKIKICNDIQYFAAYWKFDHWFSNGKYFVLREDVIKWQKIEDKETDNG